MGRARLRELGITIGTLPTGPHNAITDVPGVLVGHCTVIHDTPSVARTGVTVIVPRAGQIQQDHVFGGFHSFNGNGEMTGIAWLNEGGTVDSALAITNTDAVGMVRDTLIRLAVEQGTVGEGYGLGYLPIVAETWDGHLSDIHAFPITADHVRQAFAAASDGPVAEGNVGGGTGMICHEFKGGIGTASRVVTLPVGGYTVGVLVQANYGVRRLLRVDGVPVGQILTTAVIPSGYAEAPPAGGSIIVIVATDAPLLPSQCARLARRATVGLARVGGNGHNGSGDLFLAFATGNHLPANNTSLYQLQMVPQDQLNPLFDAVAEATEEAILNALTAAETLTGYRGRTAYALPLDDLTAIMARYPRPAAQS
jgi:D-aminopeptidase